MAELLVHGHQLTSGTLAEETDATRSRRDRILHRLRERAGVDAAIHRGILYRPAPKFFLQGLLIEGTPYRDTVYVWHLLMPLYRPAIGISLNQSRRLMRPSQTESFVGDADGIADAIHRAITESSTLHANLTWETLFSAETSVTDFAARCIDGRGDFARTPVGLILDAGVTYALLGERERAKACLRHYVAGIAASPYPRAEILRAGCQAYLDALAGGAETVQHVARRIAAETRSRIIGPAFD